jgi:ABC-2 type transport system permease protein
MNATLRTALAVVCIVTITVCAILCLGRLAGRARVADLTQHRLYTLSEGTRNILGKVNQPIRLTLYYSRTAARKGPEQIRFWNNYYLYVRDLLDEFVDRAGGKLTLEVVDPRPFSDEEEAALRDNVRRFQLSPDEAFFFGLVASTELGKSEALPFFEPDRQEFVEYDVAKLLVSLMQRKQRTIGVIAGISLLGTDQSPYMMQMLRMQGRQPESPWTLVEHLRKQYEVRKIDVAGTAPDAPKEPAIPGDIDFLLIVHPKGLDEKTRFAIDQYVMKGGKAMVFVDPHCLQDRPPTPDMQMQMQYQASSDLNDLLEAWGVRMEPGQIAVDRTLGVRVSLRPNQAPERFPAYLQLGDDQMNRKEVITSDLHTIRLLYPGVLSKVDGRGADVRPLLLTSPVGNTWKPAGPFELQFPDPATIRKAVTDGSKPLMLACLVSGKLKTRFPDGIEIEVDAPAEPPAGIKPEKKADATPEAKKEGEKGEAGGTGEAAKPAAKEEAPPDGKKPPDASGDAKDGTPAVPAAAPAAPKKVKKRLVPVTEAASGATVVVVADVDLLTDMVAYERSFFGMALNGDNASFVFNALDYLSGSEDLIALRSRGRYGRPFKVVDAIEQESEKATADKVNAINDTIKKYQEDLDKLGGSTSDKDVRLIQSEALEKRRAIEGQIREANMQLRKLQAARREKVEALGLWLKTVNITAAPAVILVIAIALAMVRWLRAKRYAARRA